MKLSFNSEDLKRLEQINENQLYRLSTALIEATAASKRSARQGDQLIYELVALAETAAKEIACRKRWSPRPSNGQYSTTGVTYDTEEYRQWLRDHNRTASGSFAYADFLRQFSFGNELLKIMWK